MKFRPAIFLLLSAFCGQAAAGELGQVNASQLQTTMQHANQPLIVDIRTPAEWQATGTIPGSHRLQAFRNDGSMDIDKWQTELHKLKTSPDQQVVLVCRSGHRSGKLGEWLVQHGENHIYHLGNGIQSWIQSGYPIETTPPANAGQ